MAERTGVPTNVTSDTSRDPASGADRDRRRLLGGGIGAAPFVMTLLSRPVFGSQRCLAPSSFASMPTSQFGGPQVCAGRGPDYWKDPRRLDQWPSPYRARSIAGPRPHEATRFDAVFALSPYPGTTSLLEVLEKDGGPTDDVARHIVATLLNVAKGWVPVLTVVSVQGIWRRYMHTGGGAAGYFEPTAGAKWFHDDIVTYLRSTMPV
jgi:hypothetical protein